MACSLLWSCSASGHGPATRTGCAAESERPAAGPSGGAVAPERLDEGCQARVAHGAAGQFPGGMLELSATARPMRSPPWLVSAAQAFSSFPACAELRTGAAAA